jgi:hypothetical protein
MKSALSFDGLDFAGQERGRDAEGEEDCSTQPDRGVHDTDEP